MDVLIVLESDYRDIIKKELNIESNIVFGEGAVNAKIMLVGEAPGKNEEETGKPFVGAAGKNLNEFLEILSLERKDIYITNVVKFRPIKKNPENGRISNRTPDKHEVDISIPTLEKQFDIIKPGIVVTLGNVPLRAVLKDDDAKIGDYHGTMIKMEKFNLFPLYHPASIIYNRSLYDIYHDDVKKLRELI